MTIEPGRGAINSERAGEGSHSDGELESDRTGESDGGKSVGGQLARCDGCAFYGPASNCAALLSSWVGRVENYRREQGLVTFRKRDSQGREGGVRRTLWCV